MAINLNNIVAKPITIVPHAIFYLFCLPYTVSLVSNTRVVFPFAIQEAQIRHSYIGYYPAEVKERELQSFWWMQLERNK